MTDPEIMVPVSKARVAKNEAHIERLHPDLRPRARAFLYMALARGWGLAITQSLRSDEEQAALYAQGRTAPGKIVTRAPTASETPHGRGCAFDVAFLTDTGGLSWDESFDWNGIGSLAEACGLEWGGVFPTPDRPHFQLPGWRTYPYPARYRP